MPLPLGTGHLRADPNVTPFIDVLLVLIIVFMLMAGLQVLQLQVAQEQGTAQLGAPPIVLELPDSGGYAINTRPVPPGALAAVLRETFRGRRPSVLFVRAGGRRTYAETIAAIDVARGAGVETIALAP